ncbi:MAG: RNA 2',3'-cyclic phosphodiesterase [Actinomycetota bacterium]
MPSARTGEDKRVRLFVGVELPDAARGDLATSIEVLRTSVPVGRWTPAANWHATVKFLGWVRPSILPMVREAAEWIARSEPRFTTRLTALGTFPPGRRRSRVLWAGMDDEGGGFARLSAALNAALTPVIEPEGRAFTPHVTLARFDPPIALPAELPPLVSEPFEVAHLVLFRSHLRGRAPIYEQIASFPLGV